MARTLQFDPTNLSVVGTFNQSTLEMEFDNYRFVSDFLHADINIPIHSTTVNDCEGELDFEFDIDGLMIEMGKLASLLGGLHYLFVPHFNPAMLKLHYHTVKKHVDLSLYSSSGLQALRHCVGHTLGYVDGGYTLVMVALPASATQPDTRLLDKQLHHLMASALFESVHENFHDLLRSLPAKDIRRPTIRKMPGLETARIHVLKRDATFILSLLDNAIDQANVCHFLKIKLYLHQFGQKDIEDIDLTDILDPCEVRSMSVHAACVIKAKDPAIHLLFSRYGLQDLVGSKGTLYSCLGMHEATNFQSNLDNHAMDVSPEVLKLCNLKEGKLTFVQLYVDSPHAHVRMPFKHPVSGMMATCGLAHPKNALSFRIRAAQYQRHMNVMAESMTGQLVCRVEQVQRFEGVIPTYLDPQAMFNVACVRQFLETQSVLVPFKDTESSGLVSILRRVLSFLVRKLGTLHLKHEGVARYDAVWKSFQIELALEEILYGHSLSPLDYQLSVALGVNTVSPSSFTQQRGFIGLAPHSSATAEETLPPLHHWTREETQMLRIKRLFPLCQVLEATPAVIGPILILLFLCDLYQRNDRIPMPELTSTTPPGRLVGAWPLDTLCEDLESKDSFPFPTTFGRARILLRAAGQNVKECLERGFVLSQINFLPAFKFRDYRGTKRLWWNFKDYVQIHAGDATPFPLSVVAQRTMEVCVEMERRTLTYSRNLERYRDNGMPWMAMVIERLPPHLLKLPNTSLQCLTFVTCVGMIMNGDFVDYKNLKELIIEMSRTLGQGHLQKFRIQSKFTLDKVFNLVVWKLHEDIPYRMVPNPRLAAPPKQQREDRPVPTEEEDVQAAEPQDDLRPMVVSQAMYVPSRTSRAWSAQELANLPTDMSMPLSAAYKAYCDKCKEQRIPMRSYRAFGHKWSRL